MPVNKDAYARYRIIDDLLNYKKYVDLQTLKEYCERRLDDTFSDSTMKNDIRAMRDKFYAPIEFDKYHKGYFYTENFSMQTTVPLKSADLSALDFAVSTLEQFQNIPILEDFKETVEKIKRSIKIKQENEESNFIQFEKTPFFKGIELLSIFSQAIREERVVNFEYHYFSDKPSKTHSLHPYLLKEYRNRWYVIGFHPERKEIRIFGLDRIANLELMEEEFLTLESFDSDDYFKYSLGITVLEQQKPQEIILLFDEQQGKYIKTQPIHETQEIELNKEGFLVKLKLLITYELVSEILSYGEKVKVLAPTSLQKIIQERLNNAIDLY